MKMNAAKKAHYDSGPNMTPLVDVVMVILIFLMLAGSFGGAEHYLVSNMPFTPQGAGSVKPPPSFVPDFPFDIRVDRGAEGQMVARFGDTQASEPEDLLLKLSNRRKQLLSAGKTIDKIQVQISPGKRVPYRMLIDVYDAALRAEFQKVAFATSH